MISFLLPDNFIFHLSRLRKDYETQAGVNFDTTSQPSAMRCFFGAKDVTSRHGQLVFIERWLVFLQKEVQMTGQFDPLVKLQNHVQSLRLLVVVCLYIQFKIRETYTIRSGASAILSQLIDQAMGVGGDNSVDHETKACCLLEAKQYLAAPGRLSAINLGAQNAIMAMEWRDFTHFVLSQLELIDKKYEHHYPITSVMVPVVAKSMQLAGYATGYVLGDMLVRPSQLLPVRSALTAVVGGCVITIAGPTSSMTAMFVTGRILDVFCGISLAWVLGTSLELVGRGVGVGIGVSLDVARKLVLSLCGLMKRLYRGDSLLTGISLINGHRVIEGVEYNLEDLMGKPQQFLAGEVAHMVDVSVDDRGFVITINGKQAQFSWDDFELARLEEASEGFCII